MELLKNNWMRVVCLTTAAIVLLWAVGCDPKAPSLMHPGQLVTRQELQIELQQIEALYEMRSAQLLQQEQLRKLIAENALLMAATGTFNPLGILTAVAAFYGIGSVAKDTTKLVKKKIVKPT